MSYKFRGVGKYTNLTGELFMRDTSSRLVDLRLDVTSDAGDHRSFEGKNAYDTYCEMLGLRPANGIYSLLESIHDREHLTAPYKVLMLGEAGPEGWVDITPASREEINPLERIWAPLPPKQHDILEESIMATSTTSKGSKGSNTSSLSVSMGLDISNPPVMTKIEKVIQEYKLGYFLGRAVEAITEGDLTLAKRYIELEMHQHSDKKE